MNKTLQRMIAKQNMGDTYVIPHVQARETIIKVLNKLKEHAKEEDERKVITICKGMCSCIKLTKKSKRLDKILEAIGEMYAIIIFEVYQKNWDNVITNTDHLINFYGGEKDNG